MFENRISNTKLTGSLADCMFRRINGTDYDGDHSFLATLRVLLMNRIPADNHVNLERQNINMTEQTAEYLSACVNACNDHHTIYVVNMRYDVVSGNEQQETAKFDGIPFPEAFHEFADVREFFSSKMACRTAINEQTRTVIILILNMNMKRYHLAQCILPKLLPWYFERSRMTANEMALLRSLRELRSAEYERVLDLLCDTDQFRRKHTAAAMASFRKRGLERQKIDSERTINNLNAAIDRLNGEILRELRNLNNENMKLSGILTALNGDDETNDELTQFVASNRNIKMTVSDTDGISFIIRGHLDIFDSESYRTIARNPNAWYWSYGTRHAGPFASKENRKMVTDAIFGVNPVFKLKTCAAFYIDATSNSVSGRSRYDYGPEYYDCYPNPHIDHNSCLGAHRSPINRAISRGDLVGAISQCISSTHSVNVTESASFHYIFDEIFSNRHAILEDMNGQSYTVLQAYEYLRNQAEQQNATSQQGE